MSISTAESLKTEWTDKAVLVKEGIPELRRFNGIPGIVKTVNMNCRCLVEFKDREDIGWYDIAPECLIETDLTALEVSKSEASSKKDKAASKSEKTASTSAKKPGGLSPLELARQQGEAGKSPATNEPSDSSQKLSPLELARQQGAVKSDKGEAAKPDQSADANAGLSPLELARQQGAAKPEAQDPQSTEAASTQSATAESATSDVDASSKTSKLSPLELARQQGAAKSEKTSNDSASEDPEESQAESSLKQNVGAAEQSQGTVDKIEESASVKEQSVGANLENQPTPKQSSLLSASSDTDSKSHDDLKSPDPSPPQPNRLFDNSEPVESKPRGPIKFGGKTIKPDDLKVVEGIGPKIESILKEAGVDTWRKLSETDSEVIAKLLTDAGPRFRMHNPGTWPEQAGMAADGKWEELKDWQDSHTAGRE